MEKSSEKDAKWIDVSIPLKTGMVTWPDDEPVVIKRKQDMDQGDPYTLSIMSMSLHAGTHMDAPRHFIKGGQSLNEMPLDATVGPAWVIKIADPVSIKIEELSRHPIAKGDRILFKTENSDSNWFDEAFNENFVYISRDAARYLVERQVRTVGIDYLSVGGYREDGPETHHLLLGAGIWVIEGMDLSKVEPGRYQLVCLPMKIMESEGAPARVILKQL